MYGVQHVGAGPAWHTADSPRGARYLFRVCCERRSGGARHPARLEAAAPRVSCPLGEMLVKGPCGGERTL
eukprot:5592820-Pyramimonas_sp.AAC.3